MHSPRAREKAREGERAGKAFFAPIEREARGIERRLRRNDDVMDDRNAEAPRPSKLCRYPSNMSTVFFGGRRRDGGRELGGLVQRGVPWAIAGTQRRRYLETARPPSGAGGAAPQAIPRDSIP